MKVLILFIVPLLVIADASPVTEQAKFTGKIWVVLAGCNEGWDNYSIKANVYRAYQMIRGNGIPEENIIVMQPDDIANNKLNPTPGKVKSEFTGSDVYHGVPKHYTGADVSVENFLGVLKGDPKLAARGKRVVNSGPNDHIFVYTIGHGDDKYTEWPNNTTLTAERLNNALKEMHQNNRFAKLVYYMEACESGSMWANFLPNNINVYAVASSKAGQISRQAFCYFKPNKDMDYCHGSLFSHYWLLDSERTDLSKETLQQQFEYIFKTGNLIDPIIVPSHEIPQQSLQFGDLSIAKLSVSEFMGNRIK